MAYVYCNVVGGDEEGIERGLKRVMMMVGWVLECSISITISPMCMAPC
jgi:hypothetical protein